MWSKWRYSGVQKNTWVEIAAHSMGRKCRLYREHHFFIDGRKSLSKAENILSIENMILIEAKMLLNFNLSARMAIVKEKLYKSDLAIQAAVSSALRGW